METQTQTQPQDQSLVAPSSQYLAALAVMMATSKLGYHYYRSKNVAPEIVCEGDFVHFEIPQDTRRKGLFGFGPETEVARNEIEIINRETGERNTIKLTKEIPFSKFPIIPNNPYALKWKTQEDGHFWSQYSNLKPLVSRSPYFTLSPGEPSRARNEESIEKIRQGPILKALILGKTGAGKSSFINSLFSAVAGHYRHVAMTSPGGLTNTQHLTEYELVPGKAYVSDMPGWEESFSLALLRRVLEGNLDDVSVSLLRGDSNCAQQSNQGHDMPRFNAVILVMSAISLRANAEFHRQIVELLKRLSIPCIGVITKMDLIVSDENRPVSRDRFFQDPRVIARYQQVPLDAKFPLINYNPDEPMKNEVDELLLHITKTTQEKSQSGLGRSSS